MLQNINLNQRKQTYAWQL